ncbi:hypothetical protein EDC01DRAFT_659500 [Geopyxis carbonaria]|nr:hypothetical protein EDC01DRAFT_659500 [Geopyxis carbonaria]
MSNQLERPIGTGPLKPSEIAFLAETEYVVIVPRQKLDGLDLISGYIPPFRPPQRASIPLWLALVLKKQKRCSLVPPVWLSSHHIEGILKWELDHPEAFSKALPWRWLELAEIMLEAAEDDIPDASLGGEKDLRVLLRGLREVRQTKARQGLKSLESTYLQMNGLGAMEITELREFAAGVMDGLRRLGADEVPEREEGEQDVEMEDAIDDATTLRGSSAARDVRAGSSTVGSGSTVGGASGSGRGTFGGSSVAERGSSRMASSSVPPQYEYEDLE